MPSLRPALLAPAVLALALLAGCASSSYSSSYDDYDDTSYESDTSYDDAAVDPAPADEGAADPAPAAPASSYSPGDPFNETCSVAWPSAPQVTATDIQITAYCPNVPSTYPVVLVVYPDPSLPITPSTGSFRVVGQVYGSDVAQSGLPYLIVLASEVRL